MRYEIYNYLASSALHALRLLQEVADAPNVHKAISSPGPASVHPNLNGCVDSPEASTMILMVVGTIGIYCGSILFARMARKRQAHVLSANF